MRNEIKMKLKKSYRYDKNGWIYLHIEGAPYERGFQHGYHMARELKHIFKMLYYITYQNTGKRFAFFAEAAERIFLPKICDEYLEELQGICEGAYEAGYAISLNELVAWNGYVELTEYWLPNYLGDEMQEYEKNKGNCSAFIATGDATRHNGIVMGHNTWFDFVVAQYFNVILDLVPSEGHRIFMQSIPGYIQSFTDFFVTGAGIIGTETTISGYDLFDSEKTPEFVRARKAMQYANTIEQWTKIMQQDNNGAYACSWLLGDIHTKEIARFELGLEYSSFDRKKNGYFVGFNAPEDARIRNLECSETGYNDVRTNGARKVRWNQLMERNYGKIDIRKAGSMMRDHYDVYMEKGNHPGERTLCGHVDEDMCQYTGITWLEPYRPYGAVDAKIITDTMAKELSFYARFGRSCGEPFCADKFLREHTQWDWQRGYLHDRPSQPWTLFRAKDKS